MAHSISLREHLSNHVQPNGEMFTKDELDKLVYYSYLIRKKFTVRQFIESVLNPANSKRLKRILAAPLLPVNV